MMLLGFTSEVWIAMAMEFAERLAYYGTTFMFMTYCTSMLRWNPSSGNALINGFYALTPVSACVSSGLSDGRWGRPFSLVAFLSIYAVGLSMVAISSYPFMYAKFPLEPSIESVVLFSSGVFLLGVGYGGMKVCTNPLMADSVSKTYKDNYRECQVKLSQLFRWIYVVTNAGSFVGIIVPPLLRLLDPRRVTIGSVSYTTGYYFGFSLSAVSCVFGLLLFIAMYTRFCVNEPAPTFELIRIFYSAIRVRWYFAIGRIRDDVFLRAHRWDLLEFAAYPLATVEAHIHTKTTSQSPPSSDALSSAFNLSENLWQSMECDGAKTLCNETVTAIGEKKKKKEEEKEPKYDINLLTSMSSYNADGLNQSSIEKAKAITAVCRALVAMPIYWLITNQFSTNLILQASATDLPPYLPPEMFSNINVISLLLSLVLFDRVIFPMLFVSRFPSVRGRVICGCIIMIISMLWCGVVQMWIDNHGTYDENGFYELHDGMEKILPSWLVIPYILQGIASALVDTTVMEVVYVAAPASMKGTVMGLYFIASSLSGFLGLALSPVMKPMNAKIIIFSLTVALSLVVVLFYFLNPPPSSANDVMASSAGELAVDMVIEPGTAPACERNCLLVKRGSRSERTAHYGGVPKQEEEEEESKRKEGVDTATST